MNAHPNFPVSKACRETPGIEDSCLLAELAQKAERIIERLNEIDQTTLADPHAAVRHELEKEDALLNARLEAVEASAVHLVPASPEGALFLLAQVQSQLNVIDENAHCDGAQKERFQRAAILTELMIHGLRRYLIEAGGSETKALNYYLRADLDPRCQFTAFQRLECD